MPRSIAGGGRSGGGGHSQKLAELILRRLPKDGLVEACPGLFLSRLSQPTGPIHGYVEPSFCVVAQGRKLMFLGRERFRYDPATYLLITPGVPVAAHVIEASPNRPCVSVRIQLDPSLITSVLVDAGRLEAAAPRAVRALAVSQLDADLSDAVFRLVRLAETPEHYEMLGPLVVREIVYRLLLGNQQDRLRHIAVHGGRVQRIVRAIELLRRDFDKPLRIANLARDAGMSTSALHHSFKAITAMSPLQFQKELRLQEARRLLLSEDFDAATAGHQVGYEDPAYFSREYKRHFGQPPMRDIERLRETGLGQIVAPSLVEREGTTVNGGAIDVAQGGSPPRSRHR